MQYCPYYFEALQGPIYDILGNISKNVDFISNEAPFTLDRGCTGGADRNELEKQNETFKIVE